jgi:hypothetical protein
MLDHKGEYNMWKGSKGGNGIALGSLTFPLFVKVATNTLQILQTVYDESIMAQSKVFQ